ncbi:hypothetical protein ACJX0J_029742, partial [Zea mays]
MPFFFLDGRIGNKTTAGLIYSLQKRKHLLYIVYIVVHNNPKECVEKLTYCAGTREYILLVGPGIGRWMDRSAGNTRGMHAHSITATCQFFFTRVRTLNLLFPFKKRSFIDILVIASPIDLIAYVEDMYMIWLATSDLIWPTTHERMKKKRMQYHIYTRKASNIFKGLGHGSSGMCIIWICEF